MKRSTGWKRSPLLWIATSVLFVSAVLVVLYAFGIHEQVVILLRWFESQGALAPLLFIAIMALVMVLLLPGAPFTMGAGFVFDVVEGTAYVVTGTVLGASLAFLMARYLFGERARNYVTSHARLRLMSEELTPNGWKIVMLTRLIPFFPAKLANYFFGLTQFSFRGFVGGSALGFIPFSLHNVYLGSLAADLTVLGVRETDRTPLEWAIYAAGFAGTVLAVFYLNNLARRALARYTGNGPIVEETA